MAKARLLPIKDDHRADGSDALAILPGLVTRALSRGGSPFESPSAPNPTRRRAQALYQLQRATPAGDPKRVSMAASFTTDLHSMAAQNAAALPPRGAAFAMSCCSRVRAPLSGDMFLSVAAGDRESSERQARRAPPAAEFPHPDLQKLAGSSQECNKQQCTFRRAIGWRPLCSSQT